MTHNEKSSKEIRKQATQARALRYQKLRESGLTVEQLARQLDYTPNYLRRFFARGDTPYDLARCLSGRIGCRMEIFL